jgi:dienelactone hydrolase
MIKQIALAALIGAATVASANAQLARLEVLPIASVTITDSDLLAGRDGKPVSITGNLRVPKSANDKRPAVILLHGSGGIGGVGSTIDEWSKELNQLGIATFAVNSFAGRGIVSTVMDQTKLARLNMVADAYRALDLLAKDPRIDSNRVAVMGFSRGAQSALYSAMNRFSGKLISDSNLRFAAHVVFYADCTTTYLGDTDVTGRPIIILHGLRDNWNAIAPCRTYVGRLKDASKDIKLIEYPDAHHAFDNPNFRKPIIVKGAPTTRRCQQIESDDHQILNRETQKPFTYKDACVEKDTTVAYNDAASSQAHLVVRDFFKKAFQLKE